MEDADAVGFVDVRADFGQEFDRGRAHRAGEPAGDGGDAGLHAGDEFFQGAEQAFQAGGVHIGLVHAGLFHQGGKFAQGRHDGVGNFGVAAVSATQNHSLGAEPSGRAHGHGGAHAKGPRLIGAGGNHAPLAAAHNDGAAAQLWIVPLLHGSEKGVHVQMQNHRLVRAAGGKGRRRTVRVGVCGNGSGEGLMRAGAASGQFFPHALQFRLDIDFGRALRAQQKFRHGQGHLAFAAEHGSNAQLL